VFKDLRDRVQIATKAGLLEYGRPPDFTPASLRRSLEGSLARLGTDYVDLLQLHNPPRRVIEQSDEIRKLVDEFRRSGKIRAFGVSLRLPEDGLLAIEHMEPDALQTNLNLLDHRAIDCGLLDLSARRGTSLIARTPLCFGFLSGGYDAETRFDDRDHRSRWSRGQVAGWVEGAKQVLCCMADPSIQTASQFALRFCLSFPEVATAIPGMLREEEVLENVKASGLGPLTPAEMAEVERAYRGNKCFTEHEGFTFDRPADPGKIDVA